MEIPNSQEILQIESEAPKSKADSLDKFNKLISQSNDKIKFIEKKLKELISIKTSLSEADKDEEINISKKIKPNKKKSKIIQKIIRIIQNQKIIYLKKKIKLKLILI